MRRLLIVLSLLPAACGEDAPPPAEPVEPVDSGKPVEPVEPSPEIPAALIAFDEMLTEDVEAFRPDDGDWTDDFGDAPFYALGYYARVGKERELPELRALADETREHAGGVVDRAAGSTSYYLEHMEEVLMSGLGLLEHMDATGDRADLARVDALIDATNGLLQLFGNYLPSGDEIDSLALDTYGPTSITAAVALLNLQYAKYLPDADQADARLETARAIIAAIDENAWDGERYAFEPDHERLCLYPNVLMMLVQTRMFEITRDDAHLTRARAIVDGIAPLEDPDHGGYHSPYSADAFGAETDDYSTLSSQNYLALALLLVYENTRERRYFDEAVSVLEFIRTKLYSSEDHRLLHHWIDGRVALPDDLVYFCSGCNFQFLYVMWHMRRIATPPQPSFA